MITDIWGNTFWECYLVMVSDDGKGWTEYATMPTSPAPALIQRLTGKPYVHITPSRVYV